jgi:hypothetical protein
MSELFEKLDLRDQQEILVLSAPDSFLPELAQLPVLTIHYHIESVAEISFFLGFVTRKSEVERLAGLMAERAKGDTTVWFAYPKGTSKRYTCDFNRDTGWKALKALGFDTVRAVAIDEDWTALRFRRVEYIKSHESNTEIEPVAAPKSSAAKLTPPKKVPAKPLPPCPRRRG